MAAYADWEYYEDTYLGNQIAEADFPRLILRASEAIDAITFGRAAGVILVDDDPDTIDLIRRATCAVAEETYKLEASGGAISSERVGNYSVTYLTQSSDEKRLTSAAKRHLWSTGLMARVVD